MITIYDAVEVDALPADTAYALAYIDGGYVTYQAVRSRFPNATIWTVTTNGLNHATICDVESGDATPAIAGAGVKAGLYPVVYCEISSIGDVQAACAPVSFGLFVADPTGEEHLYPGSLATQWGWPQTGDPGNFDVSTAVESFPYSTAPTPPPNVPTQKETMAVAPPISFAGQTHVFQGNGVLYHKWESPDTGEWQNENVFTAAGIGSPTIPNQIPGVSILSNGKLSVSVEDSTGKAWFFTQAIGGTWGVNALP